MCGEMVKRYKMKKLPFIISIPHGGTKIPYELVEDVCIKAEDLFDDSDAFTWEIYNVSEIVVCQVFNPVARAFVDVNRSIDQVPPEFSDGLIKSATCYNKPIYTTGKQPNCEKVEFLIEKYYKPYHQKIVTSLEKEKILFGLDCHTMAEIAPPISPDKRQNRPLINLGDADGKACKPYLTKLLRDIFLSVFEFHESDVTINHPFKGGYITRKYGNNPIPWVQIELNRKLYLDEQYFNKEKLVMKNSRLEELNAKFREVLAGFGEELFRL